MTEAEKFFKKKREKERKKKQGRGEKFIDLHIPCSYGSLVPGEILMGEGTLNTQKREKRFSVLGVANSTHLTRISALDQTTRLEHVSDSFEPCGDGMTTRTESTTTMNILVSIRELPK